MFDLLAKLLSSIVSILFPLFASYKALKTSDPAQLTPWLMYWVVLACVLLLESWTEWFLQWLPFYAWIRLFSLLYLVLPQTQGARVTYQTYIHPWLEENERTIEDVIASAHERAREAGVAYFQRLVELVKRYMFGLAPSAAAAAAESAPAAAPQRQNAQSYTQSLLARFSVPSARWTGMDAAGAGGDCYGLFSNAILGSIPDGPLAESPRGTLARMSFLSTQRDRLSALLSALDREALQLHEKAERNEARASSMSLDGAATEHSPNCLSSRSRSETDFEKLDAESGSEDMELDTKPTTAAGNAGSWLARVWGMPLPDVDTSSGVHRQ